MPKVLTKNGVTDIEEALMYMVSCNLATVTEMASKKGRKKFEYKRHIDIAQSGVNFIKSFYPESVTDFPTSRSSIIILNHKGIVEDWAKTFEQ